jgi:hypothetical protein
MIDSLCHHCCPQVPEGLIEIAADFELTKEIADKEIERHKKYCGGKDEVLKMHLAQKYEEH